MSAITWDGSGEKTWETGVDHGVLYPTDENGAYTDGVAWNGLTTVTESPTGGESTAQYADNIKYANITSAEDFGCTIEAFTYPREFEACDGSAELAPGLTIGQQDRKNFGFSYRTLKGNDTQGQSYGEKHHLVWGCLAAPSEKTRATVNESPELAQLSWEVTTTPIAVGTINSVVYKPTAHMVVDSNNSDADAYAEFLDIIHGTVSVDARMPTPAEVYDLFAGTTTIVDLGIPANQPTYNSGTHIVTLPAVTGVQWKINGVNKAAGAQPALAVGQVAEVTAHAQPTYALAGDDDWAFNY